MITTNEIGTPPSLQDIQPPSDRSWRRFVRRPARVAMLFATAAFVCCSSSQAAVTVSSILPSSSEINPCTTGTAFTLLIYGTGFNLTTLNQNQIHLGSTVVTATSVGVYTPAGGSGTNLIPEVDFLSLDVPCKDLSLQDLGSNIGFKVVPISVKVGGFMSSPEMLFTVIQSSVVNQGNLQSAVVPTGTSAHLQSFTSGIYTGVEATLNVIGASAVGLTVATYIGTPPTTAGLLFNAGADWFDVQANNANSSDTLTATFYCPASFIGIPSLQYMGSPSPVLDASGGVIAGIFTPGNGWTFTVTFDQNTVPSINMLSGTMFTIAPEPLKASPSSLWPPNHKMVSVTVNAPGCTILSVSSNEPQAGLGNGDVASDWQITGPLKVNLRAERGNTGGGRIYTILLQCSDGSQNIAVVRAPHDQGNH